MADVVTMPKLGFDMAEGLLVRWAVGEGQPIQKGQLLAEIETDKATVEVESTHSGVIFKHLVEEGSIVPVNKPIAVVAAPGEDVDLGALGFGEAGSAAPKPAAAPPKTAEPTSTATIAQPAASQPAPVVEPEAGTRLPEGVRATPLARKLAAERSLDLRQVAGSGPKGRVLKKDVLAFQPNVPAAPAQVFSAPPAFVQATAEDSRVPLTRLRQAIGRRMTESKQFVPHFYVTYEYDLGPLMALREQVNEMIAPTGEKLSVNDFLIKAVALCLREFPNLNASLGEKEVIRHGQINIGVAVAVEGGLLTVVNRSSDQKSVRQVAAELKPVLQRAREGKVRTEDIEGSTFSISNLGMFGVDEFVAIINPPEAAILAVGAAKQVPVVVDGALAIGWRMRATISVDHRVSDGAEAAQFMQALARYIEQPLRLML